jgi:predicted O-methyltransferase YrrM
MRSVIHRGLQGAARVPGMRAIVYASQAARYRIYHRDVLPLARLLADYPKWRDSRMRDGRPLTDGCAWVTYGAIEFLEAGITRTMRVFEYGSGGSTIFLASRAREVVSVEHDHNWAREVTGAIAALGLTNATVRHVEPSADPSSLHEDASDPDAYVSSDADFAGRSFRAYAAAIDEYADGEFDLILLDGRARPSCFKHALPKLSLGGLMILDNADRAHYAYITATMDELGSRRRDFAGAGPYNQHFWKTSVWEQPTE